MQYNDISKMITFILCVVIAVNMGLFYIAHSTPREAQGKATTTEPYLMIESSALWGGISEFAVCGDYLYTLLESRKVLNCYSLDGEYIRSYVFDMRNNGQSHLYVKDDTLYLESREHHFYRFMDGQFMDVLFPDISEVYSFREQLDNCSDAHMSNKEDYYELQGTSIWRANATSHEEIVHRPLWLLIFQGNTQLIIFLACLVGLVSLNLNSIKYQR